MLLESGWQLAICIISILLMGGGGYYCHKSCTSPHARLLKAILNDEFIPYYQPIVDARKGTLYGIEVLARWISKGRVVMEPGEFIPLAEKHNLMIHLTRILLDRVASDIYPLKDRLPIGFNVGINFSVAQKECWSLEAEFLKFKNHFDKRINVVIEVTESAPVVDVRIIEMLQRLRLQGFLIALDDFGSGCSNLVHLMRLPLDYLKMDKALVCGITADGDESVIAESVIGIADKLKLRVIAEGIETSCQSKYLLKHGGDLQQGFYWEKALTAKQFVSFLILKKKCIY